MAKPRDCSSLSYNSFFILFLEEFGHIFASQVFSTSVSSMNIQIILGAFLNYQAQKKRKGKKRNNNKITKPRAYPPEILIQWGPRHQFPLALQVITIHSKE